MPTKLVRFAHSWRQLLYKLISRNRAIVNRCSSRGRLELDSAFKCLEGYMRKHYLHITAYSCDKCGGPVISGSTGVRESDISKEPEVREVGAFCWSGAHRKSSAAAR